MIAYRREEIEDKWESKWNWSLSIEDWNKGCVIEYRRIEDMGKNKEYKT
jgi:hypothetical protein